MLQLIIINLLVLGDLFIPKLFSPQSLSIYFCQTLSLPNFRAIQYLSKFHVYHKESITVQFGHSLLHSCSSLNAGS